MLAKYGSTSHCCLVAHLYPTLCNPVGCILPGFSVHGISQARILEWVAMPSSRGSFQPRDRTQVSCIAGRLFTDRATREVLDMTLVVKNPPAMQETRVPFLGWEDPLEEGMATHSRILAWRIPWTEEPGGLQSWGHKESDTTERLSTDRKSVV